MKIKMNDEVDAYYYYIIDAIVDEERLGEK